MTIRKSFKSMAKLSSLTLLALSVVPAIANDKVTVGDVTFEVTLSGSPDTNGFSINAFNHGKTEKKCKVTLLLTKKDGSKTDPWKYDFLASVRDISQFVAGEGDLSGAPLSKPELSASCD